MEDRTQMENRTYNNRLIIGLDYGTTFTGVAWQIVPFAQKVSNISATKVISSWPGGVLAKVPSEISYSHTKGPSYQWGFAIDSKSQKMTRTKLQLDQQDRLDELKLLRDELTGMKDFDMTRVREQGGLPAYTGLEPVNIVADYLTKVQESVLKELLKEITQQRLDQLPTDLVITVPASWSDDAVNLTFRAISKAGFSKEHFKGLENTVLMSEPEAAALYSLRKRMEDERKAIIRPKDCFIQVDMGGGTVDCISYRVVSVSPPHVKIEHIGFEAGYKCGSTFVDEAFMQWLRLKLGDEDYARLNDSSEGKGSGNNGMLSPAMQVVMREFIDQIKHKYSGTPMSHTLQLPNPLYELHDPDRGINEGEIDITDNEIKAMFHFSIEKTAELITDQIGMVRLEGYGVRYVFISGGFATSPYVQKELREFGESIGFEVYPVPEPIEAVMQGAIAKRIEHDHRQNEGVALESCKRSYGVCISQSYSGYLHSEEDAYTDSFTGEQKAREQVVWLIEHGDVLRSDKPKKASMQFTRRFARKDPKIFIIHIITYDDDRIPIPRRYPDVLAQHRTVTELRYDLSHIPIEEFSKGSKRPLQKHLRADLRVEMVLNDNVRCSIFFGKRELAFVHLNY